MQETAHVTSLYDSATAQLKVPPHSVEAEQALLGGLTLDNTAWDQVADIVTEADFYRRDHRLIFNAVSDLAAQGSPFDVVTLAERLEGSGELQQAGGLAYLGMLARNTPSAANIKAYANIVRDHAVVRQLIHVGTQISDSSFNREGRSTAELLDNAERLVFEIAEQGSRGRSGYVSMKDLLVRVVDRIDTLFQQDNPITGVPTGFTDFDDLTSGLQPGDLVIVAGRPSMGKTTFAVNIAEYAAIKQKLPVAVFSMEMSGSQLAMRMLGSIGRLDQHKLRTARLSDEDWNRLTNAVEKLHDAPIHIDETPALNALELRARARRLHRQYGKLGLIVIDYLQLMSASTMGENRATEISEISRSMKALAKELHVPVIALSQLNRSLEQRPNKRPVMSDLRESGAIEQDADLILFIYRDEVYNPESAEKGKAEIIIGKQRNGPIGPVSMTFLGQYTRFENYASAGGRF